MFEQLDYPMDVIWLDIEHTHGKRYFTVSPCLYTPHPLTDPLTDPPRSGTSQPSPTRLTCSGT